MQKQLDVLSGPGRQLILKYFRPDSCMESTLIAQQVLKKFGFSSRPLSVLAFISNPALTHWLEDHAFEEMKTREEMDKFGGWLIAMGRSSDPIPPGKWNGHLVLIVENKYLFDLSLDQANRPKKNIVLKPTYFPITDNFLAGTEKLAFYHDSGVAIRYEAFPDDRSYEETAGWNLDCETEAMVTDQIVALCKEH